MEAGSPVGLVGSLGGVKDMKVVVCPQRGSLQGLEPGPLGVSLVDIAPKHTRAALPGKLFSPGLLMICSLTPPLRGPPVLG